MHRYLLFWLWLCMFATLLGTAVAGNKPAAQDTAKELSGMSIVGNDEAPKVLYIVPWKSSEISGETTMNMMVTEGALPVDRDVFMRQVDYYEVSAAGKRRER